jgi:hypothetical protein
MRSSSGSARAVWRTSMCYRRSRPGTAHPARGRQARPHWDFAAELLLKAAETGEPDDIEAATAQIERALRVEGWL